LHYAIQAAFPWYNAHLWEFSPKRGHDPRIASNLEHIFNDGMAELTEDADKVSLKTFLKDPKDTFSYLYDFGDSWEHKIVVEKVIEGTVPTPQCTAGKGMCPPEDCGGIYGYYDFVETVNDPKNPQYAEMREWIGMEPGTYWDVAYFELADAQTRMESIFGARK